MIYSDAPPCAYRAYGDTSFIFKRVHEDVAEWIGEVSRFEIFPFSLLLPEDRSRTAAILSVPASEKTNGKKKNREKKRNRCDVESFVIADENKVGRVDLYLRAE